MTTKIIFTNQQLPSVYLQPTDEHRAPNLKDLRGDPVLISEDLEGRYAQVLRNIPDTQLVVLKTLYGSESTGRNQPFFPLHPDSGIDRLEHRLGRIESW